MTKTTLSILFVAVILMTAVITSSIDLVQFAEGTKSKGKYNRQYGSATKNIVCGNRLCSETAEVTKIPSPPEEVTEETAPTTGKMKPTMEKVAHEWKTASETIKSTLDPGIGHESHQLAIILPPTGKIYKGILSYDASEPIQLVALHGPLAEDEDNGQPIWTPDGKTKFALTFIDPETSMGSWLFTGNALAVHTMHPKQFTLSYSVSYLEKEMSDTVSTTTLESVQDPGIGHETHSIVIILPPSEMTYSGLLTYSASEPIQLIALHGPLAEGEDGGQAIWTPDGKTKFGLTFVDNETNMGTWTFAGNALAVHTTNLDGFTVSYSVVAGQN